MRPEIDLQNVFYLSICAWEKRMRGKWKKMREIVIKCKIEK